MDSGYLYFLELVDTQVIIHDTQTCILTRRNESKQAGLTKHFNHLTRCLELTPANNEAVFEDILILDHDLNGNEGLHQIIIILIMVPI